MSNLFKALVKTLVLDDDAYREWRDRPNLFLRGVILIVVISLVASLVTFGTNLVNKVRPVDPAQIEEAIRQSIEESSRWNPGWQAMDPKTRKMFDQQIDVVIDMVKDIVQIRTPLPRGVSGFLEAVGGFLSRAPSALAGWLFYGALVLVAVNLLGGGTRLPDFLGMVSLYAIPGLLGLLEWIPCLGPILGLAGWAWGIVIYVKAVSVASDLDTGKSLLAVLAPAIVLFLLGILLTIMAVVWMIIVF
jgi:hypothetical protein